VLAGVLDAPPDSASIRFWTGKQSLDGTSVAYRDAWESATLMQPGQVYAIRIALFPCSNWFAPGHRLRLDIASSNFPQFDLNFNTGEPEGMSTHSRVATNTVYVDQARPSHVLLPLMPTAERR